MDISCRCINVCGLHWCRPCTSRRRQNRVTVFGFLSIFFLISFTVDIKYWLWIECETHLLGCARDSRTFEIRTKCIWELLEKNVSFSVSRDAGDHFTLNASTVKGSKWDTTPKGNILWARKRRAKQFVFQKLWIGRNSSYAPELLSKPTYSWIKSLKKFVIELSFVTRTISFQMSRKTRNCRGISIDFSDPFSKCNFTFNQLIHFLPQNN